MRLRIRPHSLWLAYAVRDVRRLNTLLPPDLSVAPVRFYANERVAAPRLLFNAYAVDSVWMRGHRVDVQTLAVHRKHRTVHLVVLDCVSDAMLWDPARGLAPPNAAVVDAPSSSSGAYRLEMRGTEGGALLSVSGALAPRSRVPDRRFVVDANRACYFGTSPARFDMDFDADAIMGPVRALARPRVTNALWRRHRAERPSHAFVHERGMTFRVHVPALWYDLW